MQPKLAVYVYVLKRIDYIEPAYPEHNRSAQEDRQQVEVSHDCEPRTHRCDAD